MLNAGYAAGMSAQLSVCQSSLRWPKWDVKINHRVGEKVRVHNFRRHQPVRHCHSFWLCRDFD